ncbi:MAG: GntR family transcriptional regulator [Christensenellales bacterium]
MKLERSNPKPLYRQLEEIIRAKIANEEWQPKKAIPSENELSKTYGLSRMTVRCAITKFVKQGALYRIQGKGTFVAEPKISTQPLSYAGIREQLEKKGYEIATRLLRAEIVAADREVAAQLGLCEHARVYAIERVRLIDHVPLSLHLSYIPVKLAVGLNERNLENEQMCVILQKYYHLVRGRVYETLESSLPTVEEAEVLGISCGFPLLLLKDTIYTQNEVPFEYSKVMFRGDKIKLVFEFDA